jgi:hypothetical protein
MFSKNKKLVLLITGFLAITLAFSSCNRGYGCPYELKSVVKISLPKVK